ncbi:MAG: ACP S-malonyltransferase, partial [Planctomycetota bacterium]|nr:ACP S-malonyltransferase [Planctomycetota bacterium]
SFRDGLELVTLRGRAMQDAAESQDGGMVALIGATEEQAGEVVASAAKGDVLVMANFNAPGQIVLSGDSKACERAVEEAQKAGIRASRLAVAGAFHSPLMAPAAERLAAALEKTEISAPMCTVMSNVTGLPHVGEEEDGGDIIKSIRRRLVEQLTMPVRWDADCRWLAGNASGEMHEMAPGKVLSGLMRRIERSVKVMNHDEPGKE